MACRREICTSQPGSCSEAGTQRHNPPPGTGPRQRRRERGRSNAESRAQRACEKPVARRTHPYALRRDARTVVSLIEMDAASGRWIVPEYIYGTARALGDEEHKARVERVELLRSQLGAPQPSPEYGVADIGSALKRIRTSLEPDEMEVH